MRARITFWRARMAVASMTARRGLPSSSRSIRSRPAGSWSLLFAVGCVFLLALVQTTDSKAVLAGVPVLSPSPSPSPAPTTPYPPIMNVNTPDSPGPNEPGFDPSAPGFDTTTPAGRVSLRAFRLAPQLYADSYLAGDVVFIGYARDADRYLTTLRAEFPSIDIQGFPATYPLAQLLAIQADVQELMFTHSEIRTVGGNVKDNVMEVAVEDPQSDVARSLRTKYGSAVRIVAPEDDDVSDETVEPVLEACDEQLGDRGFRPCTSAYESYVPGEGDAPDVEPAAVLETCDDEIGTRGSEPCTDAYRANVEPTIDSTRGLYDDTVDPLLDPARDVYQESVDPHVGTVDEASPSLPGRDYSAEDASVNAGESSCEGNDHEDTTLEVTQACAATAPIVAATCIEDIRCNPVDVGDSERGRTSPGIGASVYSSGSKPLPEANRYMNPVRPGAWVVPRPRSTTGGCTAGFMFHGARNVPNYDPNKPSLEYGTFTAGHCAFGDANQAQQPDPPGTRWDQGGSSLGDYARLGWGRFVDRNNDGVHDGYTFADAMTIQTGFAGNPTSPRKVQSVVRAETYDYPVTGRLATNGLRTGDQASMRGAVSGYHIARVVDAGAGGTGKTYNEPFGLQLRNQYKARGVGREVIIRGGDSGGPVFRPNLTSGGRRFTNALGIVHERRNSGRAFIFSQITLVEFQLNVDMVLAGREP